MSGKIATNPNRQSGVIGSVPSATTDASNPTITTNPTTGLGTEWINTTTGEIFICSNATTNENEWVGQIGNTIQPTPWGDRGICYAGGNPSRNDIAYINITSTGDTTDFGNMTGAGSAGNGWSNNSRGLMPSVANESNAIDYITISSLGDAADFGDASNGNGQGGSGNRTRMVLTGNGQSDAGGYEYLTMDTLGDAVDFGETVSDSSAGVAVCSNGGGDRMLKGGGRVGSDSVNVIEYITVSSIGNGIDFGDLTAARDGVSGSSNETRGIFYSGYIMPASQNDVIDYVTIASTGNATDFGNMATSIRQYGATCNDTRGITFGGFVHGASNINEIQYITVASAGNATDFGDIYTAARGVAGLSGDVS